MCKLEVTFFFQISVATCAVRRPQMRGATSSYGDQLKDTVALTPHSMPHSVTAGQHATHHNLSPLNAKRPRGGGTPHKHYIPSASKRPGQPHTTHHHKRSPEQGRERRPKGAGDGGRATLGTHQAPPTKKKRHPPPTNDPQSPTTTKPTERAPRPPPHTPQ